MNAYPNPVEDILHLRLAYVGHTKLMIVNTAGQVIYKQSFEASATSQTLDLQVSDWPAGVYRAVLESDQARTYQSIVKK
ncbi:MAG: T9SS type A sorting domain-containing protein [Bacteroidota bacterium]